MFTITIRFQSIQVNRIHHIPSYIRIDIRAIDHIRDERGSGGLVPEAAIAPGILRGETALCPGSHPPPGVAGKVCRRSIYRHSGLFIRVVV